MRSCKHRQCQFGFVFLAAIRFAAALPAKEKETDASKVAAPTFSPAGGVFTKNVVLQLYSSTPAAVIRYTLDGTEPLESSPVYSKPLSIAAITLVRAKAFAGASASSSTAAETYTLLDSDLSSFSSNLPLVILNSFGTNIAHEHNILGSVQVVNPADGRVKLNAKTDLAAPCWVHIRGRASLRYPKHSYALKLLNGDGDPDSRQFLGLAADSDWVLYAPYPDKTLMRDVLAYELSGRMGYWSPGCRFVEVFVTSSGARLSRRDYMGVYVLEEKIKRGKTRIDIAKLKAEDSTEPNITGGYIFKKDHIGNNGYAMAGDPMAGFPMNGTPSSGSRAGYPTGPGAFPADPKGFIRSTRTTSRSSSSSSSSSASRNVRSIRPVITNYLSRPPRMEMAALSRPAFARDDEEETYMATEGHIKTSHTNEFYFFDPSPDELTSVQKAWLKSHLNQFENALYGPDFADPARGYSAFLDVDSFIDYHIIVEATKNVDGFRFSDFFYKDRGGKIRNAPIWDWNLSFGNANGKQGWLAENWLWPQLDDREYSWYRRLFEDPDFGQRYVDRWAQLRTNALSTANILARVDQMAALLGESQKRNFEKWPIMGRMINPNYYVGSTFEDELNFMKKFIQTRLDWITRQFPPVPRLAIADKKIELSAQGIPSGEIYFTTDGSDPRVSGGNASNSAKTYSGALQLASGSKIFARVRQENRWGAPLVYQAAQ